MEFSTHDQAGYRKYLNANENVRFLEALSSLKRDESLFCKTLYFSGCRLSEGLELGPQSMDFDGFILRIETLKKRNRKHVRRVPIPKGLAISLAGLECQDEKFWNFSRTTGWRIIKRAMNLAVIEGIHACPKGLRHGFGVRAALARIPVTQIQKWMGHSKLETTSIYLDTRDKEEREMMRRTW